MKILTTVLTILFTSQLAFAALSSNNENCAFQKNRSRHTNLATCKGYFANELSKCKGNKKIQNYDTKGTDNARRG